MIQQLIACQAFKKMTSLLMWLKIAPTKLQICLENNVFAALSSTV